MVIDVETCRLSEVMTRRYRLVSLLGQGGMGRVFLCEGEEGRVAVKVTRLLQADGEQLQALKQFRHEAGILKGLSHPHLVGIRDYVEEDSYGYLVMDYLPGETLAQRVSRDGPVPVATALGWAQQLCEVLDFLHRQNPKILFRDLKPSNVMVDSQDQLKLIDFGIARAQVTGVMTATFLQGVGSAGYAPLEQYQGVGSTDERSDIYSLGATLFHVLTGRTPPSPIDVVAEDSRFPSARLINPKVPPWLDSVIKKMMATRKENRFHSAAEAGMALRRMLTVDDEPTEVLTTPQRREDKALYAVTGVLTSAALGLMGWMFVTSQSPTTVPLPQPSPRVAIAQPAPPPVRLAAAPERHAPAVVKPRPKAPVAPPPVVDATPRPEIPTVSYPTRIPVAVKKEPAPEPTPEPAPIYRVVSVGEPDLQQVVVPEVKPTPSETPPPPTYSVSMPPPPGPPGPGGFGGHMGGGPGGMGR